MSGGVTSLGLLALAAGFALAPGAASAQSAGDIRAAVFAHPAPATAGPAVAIRLAEAPPARPAGVARTSLDRAFARDRGLAAVGFLCGLDSRLDSDGGMGALGADPHGRFLGAQLRLSFK